MLKVEFQKGIVSVSAKSEKIHSFVLTAFLFAFSLHFFALLIFHIAPINVMGVNSVPQPPAAVTTEWKEEIVSSLEEPLKLNTLLPPPRRALFEQKLPDPLAKRMLNMPWETWFQKEIAVYLDQTFIKELSTIASGIEMFVFGELANRPLEWNNPPTAIPENLSSFPAVAKFAVEVNEIDGKIFRVQFMEGDRLLAKIGTEWLNGIRFEPKPHRFSSKGEIQWTVGPP